MFEDFDYLKQSLKNELVGGFNMELNNKEVEVEVFRADFLNPPLRIKNALFDLQLKRRYYDACGFFLNYAFYSDEID